MSPRPILAVLAAAALTAHSTPAAASFHFWDISEIYSNADGSVQYIELFTAQNNQQFTNNQVLRATQNASVVDYVFPSNTPAPTGNHHLLLATTGFAALPGAVTPDFIIPDDFLFRPNGTIDFVNAAGFVGYGSLPFDGITALDGNANEVINSPTNYAGEVGFIPEPASALLLATALVLLPRRTRT